MLAKLGIEVLRPSERRERIRPDDMEQLCRKIAGPALLDIATASPTIELRGADKPFAPVLVHRWLPAIAHKRRGTAPIWFHVGERVRALRPYTAITAIGRIFIRIAQWLRGLDDQHEHDEENSGA